jgi:hypothetical protein
MTQPLVDLSATRRRPRQWPRASAHADRIEQVSRCLERALFNELRARAWPQSSRVPQWLDEGYQARLDARRLVETTPSMRWREINVARIYAGALRQLDLEHRSARARSVEAELPLPVPAECSVKMREMLTVSESTPLRLRILGDSLPRRDPHQSP